MAYAWVLLFGATGAGARFAIDQWLPRAAGAFPWATLGINGAGCFLAGLLAAWPTSQFPADTALRIGLLTGFCGGFTTFSAFALQGVDLWQKQQWAAGALYLFGSPLLGLGMAALGMMLAAR